ncbi:MAG: hypothetical protein AAF546_00045 [Verrucomicrobiota bacterium]
MRPYPHRQGLSDQFQDLLTVHPARARRDFFIYKYHVSAFFLILGLLLLIAGASIASILFSSFGLIESDEARDFSNAEGKEID